MYGRTVSSSTYMSRSANHSTKGSRRGFVDVDTGVSPVELLTLAQQRDSLKRVHASLVAERKRAKIERNGTKEEYEELGLRISEVQDRISALNKQCKGYSRPGQSFDYCFVQVCKSSMTASEYERLSEKARRLMVECGGIE